MFLRMSQPINSGEGSARCANAAQRFLAGEAERRGNLELVIACAQGVTSAFAAIDKERARPNDELPAVNTKPAPN